MKKIKQYLSYRNHLKSYLSIKYPIVSIDDVYIKIVYKQQLVSIHRTSIAKTKQKFQKIIYDYCQWMDKYYPDLKINRLKKAKKDKINYSEYIKSPEWKLKSKTCILAAGNHCEICFSTYRLCTHHYSYVNLGKEKASDLFCLCSKCHSVYHKRVPINKLPKDRKTRMQRLDSLRKIIQS